MNIRFKLIDKWRTAHTFYSVQLALAIALLAGMQAEVLPALQSQLDPLTYALINALLSFALILSRVVHQGPPSTGGDA